MSVSTNTNREGITIKRAIKRAEMTANEVPMPSLANMPASELHRTVVEKKGLTGRYNLTLKWTHGSDSILMPSSSAGAQSGSLSDFGCSIYNALKEQLGLRFVSAKGPVETMVVDHVEMPSED